MVQEWVELRKNVFNLSEKVQIPMKVICGEKGILWKKWKKYFNIKHSQQEFVMIKNADHSFYEEGAQGELYHETLEFLKKYEPTQL